MARHGHGRTIIGSFVAIPQRTAECTKCGVLYTGDKESVKCRRCGMDMITVDVGCVKKIPTEIWVDPAQKTRPKASSGPKE